MLRRILALAMLALAVGAGVAGAQTASARRMAMGGVILAGGGPGSSMVNVAYRGVPAAPESTWTLPLPIGLIPLINDPPELDPDSPDFNIYELANLLYNLPWNLPLTSPTLPGNDITIAIGSDHLSVDLGDIRSLFPSEQSRITMTLNGPELGFGVRRFFIAAAPLVSYDNEFSFNDALRSAIAGEEFLPNTSYAMYDRGYGQAAAGVHLGWAGPLVRTGDSGGRGTGLYAGARVKLMRGLAYASTEDAQTFTTGDEILAIEPVDVRYVGHHYDTGPEGGGFGGGLDLGAVWVAGGVELGLGVNDIGTTFDWRVRETVATSDPVTGDYVQQVVARDVPLTSRVPTTGTANAVARVGRFLVAGDVVRGAHVTTGHLGAETRVGGALALRAGAAVDANQLFQYAAGAGLRLGVIGVDLAVASNSRNLSLERCLDLGVTLAYHH